MDTAQNEYEDDYLIGKQFGSFVAYHYKQRNITPEIARHLIDIKLRLFAFDQVALIDCRSIQWASIEALKILASDDGKKYMDASAVVVNSGVGKFIGNIFYKMLSPPFPSRFFTNYYEALHWLCNTANTPIPNELREIPMDELFEINPN